MAAAYQDRFTRFLDRVIRIVPEERHTVAPSHIAGPVFERLRYIEEDNELTGLLNSHRNGHCRIDLLDRIDGKPN